MGGVRLIALAVPGLVYFIGAGRLEAIKIGFTIHDDASARMRDLQTGNHRLLTLLGTYAAPAAEERRLHRLFMHHRLHGEWFRTHLELIAYIESKTEFRRPKWYSEPGVKREPTRQRWEPGKHLPGFVFNKSSDK